MKSTGQPGELNPGSSDRQSRSVPAVSQPTEPPRQAVFEPYRRYKIPTETLSGSVECTREEKNLQFMPFFSETVRDKPMVTMGKLLYNRKS